MACNCRIFCLSLAVACFCLLIPDALHAADDLDDVLSGFDEAEDVTRQPAPDNTELDTIMSGFEDTPLSSQPADTDWQNAAQSALPPWLDINGNISLSSSLNFAHNAPEPGMSDHRGVSKLKLGADIYADIKFNAAWQSRFELKGFYDLVYDMEGRDNYTDQVLDEYGKELELGEVWLQGRISDNVDLKTGRQIVVWGKSDNIRITDILNPLDNRELGLVDIKDLRLPVAMTKMDYYTGPWNISAMVIHEFRKSKIPVYGSDYYPGSSPPPSDDKPGFSLANQEYALAANGIFRGWDISFYGARVFDDIAHVEQKTYSRARKYSRLGMVGSALNIARGNWLLKSEAAFLDGIRYSLPVGEKSRLDVLLGAEYTGISETVISMEVADRHIFSFDRRLKDAPIYGRRDDLQTALRVNRDFQNDTLKLTWLLSLFGIRGENGLLQRLTLEYELTADTNITAGIVTYQSGDNALFRTIGDNDRIFLEVRTYF
ncbi:MAG: hypothetical protein KQH63_05425 [Desulfobulbaceae bacterium]|nr:hypothetical protein [Desulfobulbaceae bacterium]